MWRPTISSDELWHHGILGQEWGKRNGPPYPLDVADHSKSEKEAGYQKSIAKGAGNNSKRKTEIDDTLQRVDSMISQYKKTKTNKAGIKKRDKLKKQYNKELNKIDEVFNNPDVQKNLLTKAVDEGNLAADYYIDRKIKDNFGDWHFSEYKTDRGKKAHAKSEEYNKQRKNIYDQIRSYELKVTRDGKKLTKEEEKHCRELANKRNELYEKSWKTIVIAAMKDCGFDESIINDPDMLKKMKYMVI